MRKTLKHLRSFIERSLWLAGLMGGVTNSAAWLIKARGKPFAEGTINYKNLKLNFRNCDATAVKEVLIDEEYKFLRDIIISKNQPNIIDIGAHIGTFSVWALSQNPNIRIHSVEADPDTYKILNTNITSNFTSLNSSIQNRAAWSKDTILNFNNEGDSMGHRLDSLGKTEVRGISLEALTQDYNNIDLMKIDIEGAEEEFLCADNHALNKVQNLVIELHPKLCDANKVKAELLKYFSVCHEIENRIDQKPLLYLSKTSET